jgi:hypothetical protein
VTITAPTEGFLVITASMDGRSTTAGDLLADCWIALDGTEVNSSDRTQEYDGNFNNDESDCATNTTVPIHAGAHTVDLDGDPETGVIYDEAALSAMFVPYDGSGNPPTSFTPLAPSRAAERTHRNR